jgi:hypothetical protein
MGELSKSNQALIAAYKKGYRIINGEIFNPKGKRLKGYVKQGYLNFNLKFGPNSVSIKVHRFVAYQEFGDETFNSNLVVRHLDGNSLNNSIENLALGTDSDNQFDRHPYVRAVHALKTSWQNRILDDEKLKEFKKDRQSGMSYNQLMKKYGISSKGTVSFIIKESLYYKFETLEKAIEYLKEKHLTPDENGL